MILSYAGDETAGRIDFFRVRAWVPKRAFETCDAGLLNGSERGLCQKWGSELTGREEAKEARWDTGQGTFEAHKIKKAEEQ